MKAVEKTKTVEFGIWTGENFHKLKSVFGRSLCEVDGMLHIRKDKKVFDSTLHGSFIAGSVTFLPVRQGSFIAKDDNGDITPYTQSEFNDKYDIIRKNDSEVKIGRSQPDAIVNINIDAKQLAKQLANKKVSDAFDDLVRGVIR